MIEDWVIVAEKSVNRQPLWTLALTKEDGRSGRPNIVFFQNEHYIDYIQSFLLFFHQTPIATLTTLIMNLNP